MGEELSTQTMNTKELSRLLEMNREAARYFRDTLLSPYGSEGLEYLKERKLTSGTIRKYGLGYATDEWHGLHYYLRKKGYSDSEMEEAALVSRGKKGVYDKFRQRVIFPIIDRCGNVVAFGGRALDKEAKAKYINSDETPLFHKRMNLFSLNFAQKTKKRYLILCEGYMDVISLNQAGFENAIATLGTSMTIQQAEIMKHYAEEIIISYDSDEAGQNAAKKAIGLLNEVDLPSRVIKIPNAKDPDEYIKAYGAKSFEEVIKTSISSVSFEFEILKNSFDIKTVNGKAEFLKKAIAFLAGYRDKYDCSAYKYVISDMTGIPYSAIDELVEMA